MNLKKFLRFHHVTSMSSYFPKVPNVFLKDPSNNTSLHPISFAQISFPFSPIYRCEPRKSYYSIETCILGSLLNSCVFV
jgi:hypothetical protein